VYLKGENELLGKTTPNMTLKEHICGHPSHRKAKHLQGWQTWVHHTAMCTPAPAEHVPWKSSCAEAASTQEENIPICRVYDTTCWSERYGRFQTYERQQIFKIICFELWLQPMQVCFKYCGNESC